MCGCSTNDSIKSIDCSLPNRLNHLIENANTDKSIDQFYSQFGFRYFTHELCIEILDRPISRDLKEKCICKIKDGSSSFDFSSTSFYNNNSFSIDCAPEKPKSKILDSISVYFFDDQKVREGHDSVREMARVDSISLAYIKRNFEYILKNKNHLTQDEIIGLSILHLHNTLQSTNQDKYIFKNLLKGYSEGLFDKSLINDTVLRHVLYDYRMKEYEKCFEDPSICEYEDLKFLVEVFKKLQYDPNH